MIATHAHVTETIRRTDEPAFKRWFFRRNRNGASLTRPVPNRRGKTIKLRNRRSKRKRHNWIQICTLIAALALCTKDLSVFFISGIPDARSKAASRLVTSGEILAPIFLISQDGTHQKILPVRAKLKNMGTAPIIVDRIEKTVYVAKSSEITKFEEFYGGKNVLMRIGSIDKDSPNWRKLEGICSIHPSFDGAIHEDQIKEDLFHLPIPDNLCGVLLKIEITVYPKGSEPWATQRWSVVTDGNQLLPQGVIGSSASCAPAGAATMAPTDATPPVPADEPAPKPAA
jgi:hypothetical protein